MDHHVTRLTRLDPPVLIGESWYYTRMWANLSGSTFSAITVPSDTKEARVHWIANWNRYCKLMPCVREACRISGSRQSSYAHVYWTVLATYRPP